MVRRSSRKINKKFVGYLLILPQIFLGTIFIYGIVGGIIQSLGYVPALSLNEFTLKYYVETANNEYVIDSIKYSLYIAFVSSTLSSIIGIFIAVLIVSLKNKFKFLDFIVQIPIAVPPVVVALFMVILLSQNGILARVVASLGFITDQNQFPLLIYDENAIGVILAYLWKEIPFIIFILLGIMENIDKRLGEASENLGANKWQSFFRITLPLCMPAILSTFIIVFVFSLGAYDLPFILGATKPKALAVLSYERYTHPELSQRPYAMVINSILSILSICSAIIYFKLMKKSEENLKGIV